MALTNITHSGTPTSTGTGAVTDTKGAAKGAQPSFGAFGGFSNVFGNLLAAAGMKVGMKESVLFGTTAELATRKAASLDKPEPRQKDAVSHKADDHDRADAAPARNDRADNDTRADQKADAGTDDEPAARADSGSDDQDTRDSAGKDASDKTQTSETKHGKDDKAAADEKAKTTGIDDTAAADAAYTNVAVAVANVETVTTNGDAADGPEKVEVQAVEASAGVAAANKAAESQVGARGDAAPRMSPNERAAQGLETASSNAAGQARVNSLNAAAQDAGEAAELPALLQQQQADLSKHLNNDRPAQVHVAVQDKAGPAVNQTPGALTAAVVASEVDAQADTIPHAAQRPVAAAPTVAAQTAGTPGQVDTQLAANPQMTAIQAAAGAAGEIQNAAARTTSQGPTSSAPTAVGDVQAAGATAATGPASQTAETRQTAATQQARPATAPQKTMEQISVNISKAVSQGMDRISIQLRPAELGRVEVHLDVSHAGRVSAHVIVDRPETLDMLRNDARGLEKALQDAGLDTSAGDLNFSLRGENQEQADRNGQSMNGGTNRAKADKDLEEQIQALTSQDYSAKPAADGRIDIRA